MSFERFDKLPDEKRKRILEAAKDEFLNSMYEKASINKIIQAAGISRGSFYTYFEDKQDLLECVMFEYCRKWVGFFQEVMKRESNDFWRAAERWVTVVAEEMNTDEVRKAMLLAGEIGRRFWEQKGVKRSSCVIKEEEAVCKWIVENADGKTFDKNRPMSELNTIISILFMLGFMCLGRIFSCQDEKELVLSQYRAIVSTMQYGNRPDRKG